MEPATLIAGLVFGIYGLYFLRLGRRLNHAPSIIIGIILMVFPYFIDRIAILWTVGVSLILLAYRLI
jgi:hypothetical protein